MTRAAKQPTETIVQVTNLTHQGHGLAEFNNKPLHIRNALPGESVNARILKKRGGKLFADAVAVLGSHNPDRVESGCSAYPRCGGCSMHHIDYHQQLKLKQNQVAGFLEQQNVSPLHWNAPVSGTRLGYRRKARLGVRQLGEQVLVGFRESFSNRVARLSACVVLTPELSALIPVLKQLLGKLSIAASIPQIEFAQGDHSVALMLRHLLPLSDQDLHLVGDFQSRHGVQVLLQSGGYDTLATLDGSPIKLLGYQIPASGVYMQFDPRQFTQVNQPLNLLLIQAVLSHLSISSPKRIADMFCGLGNFSLPLARAGAKVWGFEVDASAVARGIKNAELNNVAQRVHLSVADLYNEENLALPKLDALLLDPPRSGAGPHLLSWIQQSGCDEVVYVSCNPETFAEDAALLTTEGFSLAQVGVFDMFPHTSHIETLGYFTRRRCMPVDL